MSDNAAFELDEDQEDHEAVQMEDVNQKLERKKKRERLYFDSDPDKRIDYVLVYKDNPDEKEASAIEKVDTRRIFEENLKKGGLELEYENSGDNKSHCIKLHVTWPTLAKIATVLYLPKRIRMPKDYGHSEGCLAGCCSSFEVGEPVLQEEDDYFTAEFDKDNLKMFDFDPENVQERRNFFTPAERSIVCKEVLDRTTFSFSKGVSKFGINRLLKAEVYQAAYPLHEGPIRPLKDDPEPFVGEGKDRARLYEAWARPGRFYCYQPLDFIRKYFGEKVGIYFAWLGFYTQMLIPASIAGLVVFVYGLATLFEDVPSSDICEGPMSETVMCPLCDKRCSYWKLKASCIYSRITHVFDNYATVVFAAFMSIWATIFLEFWFRKQKTLQYDWDVVDFETEERIRPEFEFKVKKRKKNPITLEEEPVMPPFQSFCRRFTSFSIVIFWICLVIVAIVSIVIYRIVVAALIYKIQPDETLAKLATTISASIISLLVITILNQLYGRIAIALTEMELPRTWTLYEDSLTTKMFLFQFVNYYGTIFYIAFFKGRFNLVPGVRKGYLFGRWRQDTCDASGCFVDLFIQLAIIMIGKQAINNLKEIIIPWLRKCWVSKKNAKQETDEDLYLRWEQDRDLPEQPKLGLFDEYLEMVIQFGFVTIFVAAFPLAPLFALLNNIVEIRLDAYKFVGVWRRGPALKAQDIGAWYGILQGISFLAVISNAFIIGYTSDFVPKLVYLLTDGEGELANYLNHSLSIQRISRFEPGTKPDHPGVNITDDICRYRGYYEDDDTYRYSQAYWKIFTARLAFVIVFEHTVFILSWLVSYVIPDVPYHVRQLMLHEKTLTRELRYRAALDEDENKASTNGDPYGLRRRNVDNVSQNDDLSRAGYIDTTENGNHNNIGNGRKRNSMIIEVDDDDNDNDDNNLIEENNDNDDISHNDTLKRNSIERRKSGENNRGSKGSHSSRNEYNF